MVAVPKHIEDDLYPVGIVSLPFLHRLYGYLCYELPREMVLASGNTAKGHAVQAVLRSQCQTGAIAACELIALFPSDCTEDDRAYCVQHMAAGKVVRLRDLRASCGFLLLLSHELCAFVAKLHARIGVDGVVYAAMAGSKAAQHLAVGGIHNGVDRKGGNVALPEIEARLYREQIGKPCDTPLCKALLQVLRILYPQKFRACRKRWAHVHEAAQKPPPFQKIFRYPDVLVFPALRQEAVEQKIQSLVLCHRAPSVQSALRARTCVTKCGHLKTDPCRLLAKGNAHMQYGEPLGPQPDIVVPCGNLRQGFPDFFAHQIFR